MFCFYSLLRLALIVIKLPTLRKPPPTQQPPRRYFRHVRRVHARVRMVLIAEEPPLSLCVAKNGTFPSGSPIKVP